VISKESVSEITVSNEGHILKAGEETNLQTVSGIKHQVMI